ncbi:TetR family transcriptional regulator [Actinophytocola xinjiangensis]|uniref:TetR family transcriptional regulator n=1 Tax=Actinophytocola xinjiangensis TaxID=485602 RepID=A0A7Z0WPE6_9PSEU|nr:TetR/AcrR family transcriptional regulator [Actinophytocola xinjiangensis]OLF09757.1 TetR family transcriptional regulator [Actinophytocola xinjiangensis]
MTGLRERKKQATRVALREAALRLALERGVDNVRVDDIAAAAGVSPRTYNNYFSSREEAIVAGVTAEREARVAEIVARRAGEVGLAEAVVEAVVGVYTGDSRPEVLSLITGSLREGFVASAGGIEGGLARVVGERVGDARVGRVLAAGVVGAVRVALDEWVEVRGGGLVVVSGSLEGLIRRAVGVLVPALEAAEAG